MTRTRWIVLGFAILLGVLAVAQWFSTHKRVTKEVRVPPSGEARQNPYLGLERTLRRSGVDATTEISMTAPDPERSILLLTDRSRDLSPKQLPKWREWVRNGGHLVATAPPAERTADPLLERLGFTHPWEDSDDSDQTESDDEDQEGSEGSDSDDSDEARAGGGYTPAGTSYDVTFPKGTKSLEGWRATEIDWRAFDGDDHRIAFSRPVGAGRVTLVAGAEPLRNINLDEGAHAQFGWDLLTLGSPDEPKIAIVRFVSPKSWMAYVSRHTWPGLVALALALIVALNGSRWQFGPERPTSEGDRRSRSEHIRATGEFLWEHDASSRLVDSARESLFEALERRRPSLKEASIEERREIVCDELDLSEDERHLMFDDRAQLSEGQFKARIDLIERHRRRL